MSPSIDFPSVPAPGIGQTRSSFAASSTLSRVGLFLLFLICSLAVILFGANYYPLFPTNGSLVYNGALCLVFLCSALWLKRSDKYARYWMVAYAFFIAAAVIVVQITLGRYTQDFIGLFGSTDDPNKTQALGKLYDTLLVVGTILSLTLVAGGKPASLVLSAGNQYRMWGYGIGSLVLVNFFTSVLIFFGPSYELSKLGPAILWGLVFAFSNGLLEELWIRGLFLKKYTPLVGVTGAILLTTTTYAVLHFLGVAYLPASTVPIFVLNTFTLGLACGILMMKTDSIWGAYLMHAAADLFLFIATLAVH